MEVVKTENIEREVNDVDSSSTIKVSFDNEGTEQMAFRYDVRLNKISSESTKYENDIQKEDSTSDDTKINIKTEINDEKGGVYIEYELSCDQLKPVKVEDYKIEHDDEYMEQTAEGSCVSLNRAYYDHGLYLNDMETIKREQNVEKEDTYSGIEAEDAATNCKDETKIEHQPLLPVYKMEANSALQASIKGTHRGNVKYSKCLFCEYITKYTNSLKLHFLRKHNENSELYYCFNCKYRTKVKNDLVEHCRVQHNERTRWHKCHLCDFKTKYKHHLLQHHRLQHDDSAEIFQCALCDFRTKYKSNLLAHRRLKHDNAVDVLRCELCDFKTKRKHDLLQHNRLKHEGAAEIFHCKMCNFKTQYKYNLLQHQRIKHNVSAENFHCELCDFKTKYKKSLSHHHRLKH